MGFISKVISGFRSAAKAGKDFTPLLEEVVTKLESLHAEGKLDQQLYAAEQAYEAEHKAYAAKGDRTDAADSNADVAAMNHFMNALKESLNTLDPSVKEDAAHLLDLKDQMMNILGDIVKTK